MLCFVLPPTGWLLNYPPFYMENAQVENVTNEIWKLKGARSKLIDVFTLFGIIWKGLAIEGMALFFRKARLLGLFWEIHCKSTNWHHYRLTVGELNLPPHRHRVRMHVYPHKYKLQIYLARESLGTPQYGQVKCTCQQVPFGTLVENYTKGTFNYCQAVQLHGNVSLFSANN